MAEDCPTLGIYEGLFTRKLTLEIDESAAITDPQRTLMANILLNSIEDIHFAAVFARATDL